MEFIELYTPDKEGDLDEWIASLKEDLVKTPKQMDKYNRINYEQLMEGEWKMVKCEIEFMRHNRDEWDNY